MPILIPHLIHAQLIATAETSRDMECCGLLLGRYDRVEGILRAPNAAADPATSFEIDSATLIAALKAEREGATPILGCYHSHPNGRAEPSPQDAADAAANGWIWLIVAGGDVTGWRAVEAGSLYGRFNPVPILQC